MSLIRDRDTKPELFVRRLAHGMGYRYRLHPRDLPGKPDMVFPKRKKAIFIHGCFWHRHADASCKMARLPKSRLDYWESKLAGNSCRDKINEVRLHELGWEVLVIWECEANHVENLRKTLRNFLG